MIVPYPFFLTEWIKSSLLETVRKGILRQWLGTLPSMRRAYQTDLSDAEWACIEPHLPTPTEPPDGPEYIPYVRSLLTPSSISCVVAVPGAYFPTT
jgi:hypothetical protein